MSAGNLNAREQAIEYSVYARTDQNNRVIKIFSTCFEQPLETDILIKSGYGDEFIHVGYYEIFTKEGAYAYKIEDGELVECTEEEIEEEVVTDNYSGEVNELESYSGGKLATAGWYRIAKYPGGDGSAYANSCEINIKRAQSSTESEYYSLKLISVTSVYQFKPMVSRSIVQLIDKIRYTCDETAGYIEIYYNGNDEEAVHISIAKAKDYNYKWSAITPELIEEEIDGVNVITSSIIHNNIDLLTNEDIVEYALKEDLTKVSDDAKSYTDNRIDEIVGEGASETLDTIGEIAKAFEEHQEVAEAINEAIGKKANASDLTSHIDNNSNPHGVTKSQVGLGNVPNVATNNQTPTYTVATANAELTSGEKLSVAFGKIAKAIKSLISHLGDTTSHVTSTERSTWNSKVSEANLATLVNNLIESGDLEVSEKAYTPSNNLLKTVLSSEKTDTNTSGKQMLVARWVPECSGQVKVTTSLKLATKSNTSYSLAGYLYAFSLSTLWDDGTYNTDLIQSLESVSVGTILSIYKNSVGSYSIIGYTGNTSWSSCTGTLLVQKGVPVYFVLSPGYESNPGGTYYSTIATNSIKIYADEV